MPPRVRVDLPYQYELTRTDIGYLHWKQLIQQKTFRLCSVGLVWLVSVTVSVRVSITVRVSLTLVCMELCLNTQLVFNVSSMQWLGLSCTSILVHLQHLHSLQMNFSNSSTGFLLNGIYGLNLPPWPSKLCTLIARHIFLTSCKIMNLRGLWAHPVLISS